MKKILVVDDDRACINYYREVLKDYDLRLAGDGVQARRVLASGFKPDIIFSDWNMPRMNGGELCQFLRTDDDNTPFYIISGDLQDHASVGANGSFLKPVRAEEIIKIVESLPVNE